MRYLIVHDPASADALAEKAVAVYSRLQGKDRVSAQIEFLRFLQTWSPFYGSTFYRVQCQYDQKPLDSSENSNPPVVNMTAAVGPQAILLLTNSESTLLRHPYQRIVKWIAHADKHIFTYWVIKPAVKLSDIERYQETQSARDSFDPRPYCDCVYLVTPQVRELEHLVKSYVQSALTGTAPSLPDAPEELQPPVEPDFEELYNQLRESLEGKVPKHLTDSVAKSQSSALDSKSVNPSRGTKRVSSSPVKMSRLSVFLSALGSGSAVSQEDPDEEVVTGSGVGLYSAAADEEEPQEIGGVLSSLFKNMYTSPAGRGRAKTETVQDDSDEDASLRRIPTSVRYASTLAELQKVASDEHFSDDEEDDEPSSSEDEKSAGCEVKEHSDQPSDESEPESLDDTHSGALNAGGGKKVRRDSALARASRAFFKAVGGSASKSKRVKEDEEDSSEEEDEGPQADDEEC